VSTAADAVSKAAPEELRYMVPQPGDTDIGDLEYVQAFKQGQAGPEPSRRASPQVPCLVPVVTPAIPSYVLRHTGNPDFHHRHRRDATIYHGQGFLRPRLEVSPSGEHPHHGGMEDTGSTQPTAAGHGSERVPESYVWPLTALVLVIVPQVLVPAGMREGPPVIVPIVEGCVALILLAVAAKPGPVPRGARPLILILFAVLIVANTTAAVRLVTVVLRSTPAGEPPPTVTQLLVGAGIVLATNIVTFGLLYWQITAADRTAAWSMPISSLTSSSHRPSRKDWGRRTGSHGSMTTCT